MNCKLYTCSIILFLKLLQIDLIPAEVVVAWKNYFQTKFPELNIICFTSFPKDPQEIKHMETKGVD